MPFSSHPVTSTPGLLRWRPWPPSLGLTKTGRLVAVSVNCIWRSCWQNMASNSWHPIICFSEENSEECDFEMQGKGVKASDKRWQQCWGLSQSFLSEVAMPQRTANEQFHAATRPHLLKRSRVVCLAWLSGLYQTLCGPDLLAPVSLLSLCLSPPFPSSLCVNL